MNTLCKIRASRQQPAGLGFAVFSPYQSGHMGQGAGLQAEGLSETPLEDVTEAS